MSEFTDSTHSTHWILSVEQQDICRAYRHRHYLTTSSEEENKIIQAIFYSCDAARMNHVDYEPMSIDDDTAALLEEDEVILTHFCHFIRKSCGPNPNCAIRSTWRVPSTAVSFFRRFYLHNSLRVHDPRVIMIACIFLAGKAEEDYIPPTLLLSKVHKKCNMETLLSKEEHLLEGLNFDLRVFHPQVSIYAFVTDMRRKSEMGRENAAQVFREWVTRAENATDVLMNSKMCLSVNPSLVAIGALIYTEPENPPLQVREYIRERFGEIPSQTILHEAESLMKYFVVEDNPSRTKSALQRLVGTALWGKRK